LFLTPMSFLISITRNARVMIDRLALVLGLIIGRCWPGSMSSSI